MYLDATLWQANNASQIYIDVEERLWGITTAAGPPIGPGTSPGVPTRTRNRPGSTAPSNRSPGTAPSPRAQTPTPEISISQSAPPRRFASSPERPVPHVPGHHQYAWLRRHLPHHPAGRRARIKTQNLKLQPHFGQQNPRINKVLPQRSANSYWSIAQAISWGIQFPKTACAERPSL